jgi:hypothetical protein
MGSIDQRSRNDLTAMRSSAGAIADSIRKKAIVTCVHNAQSPAEAMEFLQMLGLANDEGEYVPDILTASLQPHIPPRMRR